MLQDKFIARIEKFLRKHKMPEGRFGKLALGDSGFLFTIRNGRSPTARTMGKVDDFMVGYKNVGLATKVADKAA